MENYYIVLGTRPEIIKLAPVMKELEKQNIDYTFIHTGQHWDPEMDTDIISDLEIRDPDYKLDLGIETSGKSFSGRVGNMTFKVREVIEEINDHNKRSMLYVQGDTLSVMAGAYASTFFPNIMLSHVEAGLRSRDYRMPEEHIRIMVDSISDLLFVPSQRSYGELIDELVSGWIKGKVHVVGNTIVDVTLENMIKCENKSLGKNLLKDIGVDPGEYIFMTLHRAENVSDPKIMDKILQNTLKLYENTGKKIIFSVHPNTENKLTEYGVTGPLSYMRELAPNEKEFSGVYSIGPVSPLTCLYLEKNAAVVLTDSGGLQEEACTVGTPCVTLREETERPETISCGSNKLVRMEKMDDLVKYVSDAINSKDFWIDPYGDGKTSERIVNISREYLSNGHEPVSARVERRIPHHHSDEFKFPQFAR